QYRIPNMHWFFGKQNFESIRGGLDDIGIWDRALNDNEIRDIFHLTEQVKYIWSNGDTSDQMTVSALGKNRIWVKTENGPGSCYDSALVSISKPKVIIINNDSLNCFCESSVKLATSAKDGISPYKYQWNDPQNQTSDTAVSLKKGVYKIWITDAIGCKDSAVGRIDEPDKISISLISVDSVSCNGGSDGRINITAKGGTNSFSYVWNDPMKQRTPNPGGLKKGTYTLNIKDKKGCTDSTTVRVNEPDKLVVKILSQGNVNCINNQSGTLEAQTIGGNGGYNYRWNDALGQTTSKATNLSPGFYTVQVRDRKGCMDSLKLTLSGPSKVKIDISRIDSVSCNGYTNAAIYTTTVGGGGIYNWQWNDPLGQNMANLMNVGKGTYKVVVKDQFGCSDSISKTIGEPQKINTKIISNTRVISGSLFTLNYNVSPTGSYLAKWEPNSILNLDKNSNNPKIRLFSGSEIKLSLTNSNGCISRDSLYIEVIRPIAELMPTAFSPNGDGINDIFSLPDIFSTVDIIIYDRWGGIIFKGDENNNKWNGMVLDQWVPEGVYSYKIAGSLKGSREIFRHNGTITLLK
ncbi:MAG: gliding motility-associated C-terminal domain-containing protein, partial [Sphingomonadales bacterium]